jgi:hypothetical protein
MKEMEGIEKVARYFKEWSSNCRIFIDYKPIHSHDDLLRFAKDYNQASNEWISVDTPPKDDRLILMICTNRVGLNDSEQFYLGEYHSDSECWISQDGDEIHNPCYWMDFTFTPPKP